MTKIVLDAESFKALASDTRLHILKALDARPLTVSELSRLLDLNKATVFEHLKQLTVAELAKREEDPARKWVYYKLTWKGRNVLHPENAQIFIMLGLAALGMGGFIFQSARLLQLFLSGSTSSDASAPEAGDLRKSANDQQQPQAAGSGGSTASSTQSARMEQDMANAPGEADQAPSTGGSSFWDDLQAPDVLIVAAIVSFLVLLALLIRSLYGDQRRERNRMRQRIAQLPRDVNLAEGQAG